MQFRKFLFTISSLELILHLLYQGCVFSKIWRKLSFVYYIEVHYIKARVYVCIRITPCEMGYPVHSLMRKKVHLTMDNCPQTMHIWKVWTSFWLLVAQKKSICWCFEDMNMILCCCCKNLCVHALYPHILYYDYICFFHSVTEDVRCL